MDNCIGLNIKYLLIKKKLSQKEFGELFGIKQGAVSGYITGRTEPNISFLKNVSKHFEVTIDDFINVNLEEQSYINKAVKTGMFSEPVSSYGQEPADKLLTAQEKTIALLEKHIVVLEKQIGFLERDVEKLQHKAS
jgi:transcriptional regulator with XRE-family HTH domain